MYFLASYQGQTLYFRLGGGVQHLRIRVDGRELPPLLKASQGTYRIRAAGAGKHVVRIDTVNENIAGPVSLGAFTAGADARGLTTAPAKRQMEFIGDSHTVGYGNVAGQRECSAEQVWAGTDASQSPGAETASHYGAEYQILAISGRGVVRNLHRVAGDTVPAAYPFVLLDEQSRYQDPSWHPSVVVVSLGVNDLAGPLEPGESWKTREELQKDFERGYLAFVRNLRERNPGALLVLWATDMAHGEIASVAEKLVGEMRKAGYRRIELVKVTGLEYKGCDWHPSAADDRAIADRLIQVIDRRGVWRR